MARGDTAVEIVAAPINATTILAAFDLLVANTAIGISGSYLAVPFNDNRALALLGVDRRKP